jgi:hypothetical protein
MFDYYSRYIKDERLDLAALINDDFVSAIRILWNARHYNSALKLLLCLIDTMSFVSTGRSNPGSFKGWLSRFVDLTDVGITADELWEHRNAILHLSTYESNKVRAGAVRKLVPYIGRNRPPASDQHVYYDIHALLMAVFSGLGRYLQAMDRSDEMRQIFCRNYEKTISDAMLTYHE